MALAVCHVLCWPALSMDMPIAMAIGIAIAMALVLTLSMSLGLAPDRWPTIAKDHDCGPALLSRHITRAYLVRAGQIHAIPCPVREACPARAGFSGSMRCAGGF